MKKIKLAIINTNYAKINRFSKQGTQIFDYILITSFMKFQKKRLNITSFCTGDSQLPTPIESISYRSSLDLEYIGEAHQQIFEYALINKALTQQSKFDIFHVNMGVGEYILPFAHFVKKPIVITMHASTTQPYLQKYMSLFKDVKNVYFVSISNFQRKGLPHLNYIKTIYHGINIQKFAFDPIGDKNMIWTGRAVPEKGLDVVLQIAKKLRKPTKIFPLIRSEYLQWLHTEILKKHDLINQIVKVTIDFNVARNNLVCEYQKSKLFIFPLSWDEPFGLTLIESMACGTPIVTYARGSIPEVIKDGITGFIVNPSDDDIRGNWIIKKTGIEGLCEAIERIYAMSESEYLAMRHACRKHVEDNFSAQRMTQNYVDAYEEILSKKRK